MYQLLYIFLISDMYTVIHYNCCNFTYNLYTVYFCSLKLDITDNSTSVVLYLADVDSASICEIVEIRRPRQGSIPSSIAFWPKFAAELRNQTSFSATEVRLPDRGRPLGDNEPKVTRTGWCLYYCCRWLPTELDGTWPRFPWFTEVPNRVPPFEDISRARWLHNESFYLHGTYVLARVPALRCSGNLCVPSRSFLIRQIRIEVSSPFASYGKGI